MRPFLLLRAAVLLAGVSAPALAAGEEAPLPRFSLPLDCPIGNACDLVKLVDHDPGPGAKDYACGTLTGGENSHTGTDFAIRDMRAMRAGVTVRAAADGTVLRIRDGMADTGIHGPETREELSAKGCGNAVVLSHGGGWQTTYCHMRQGSVRVAPGDTVRTGDAIGQVGMSGLTELPHLHFQVNRGREVVDPFTGTDRTAACGIGPHPLWTAEALQRLTPYRPVAVRLAGFSAAETNVRAAREGQHAEGTFPACAPALVFWTEIIGVKAGDQVALRVEGPGGRAMIDQSTVIERDRAQVFLQARSGRGAQEWPEGSYRGTVELKRGRDVYRTRATARSVPDGC